VSRNTRILLIAVLAVLAAGGYWKLALAPKRAQAAELATQVASAQAQLSQEQSLLATYQGAQAQYKANYAEVVRLGKAVPSDDDARSLVVQLDAAAKRSGTDFDTFDVSASGAGSSSGATGSSSSVPPGAVSAGSYSAMPLSLSFSGDFATLENFLGRVQRFVTIKDGKTLVNGRLMRVESISLAPGDTGWPSMDVQIGADTYIVPDDQAAAAPSAQTSTSTSTSTSTTTTTAPAADRPAE
jgi:Tfp pilus assembly protein PilO